MARECNFNGKVAIITGGANGIGKAISELFLHLEMKVCICDIDEEALKQRILETPDDLKNNLITAKCDVSIFEEFKAAFEKTTESFGRPYIVINNAGIINEKHWRKVIEVNFVGVIHGIQLGFEFMGKNNGGDGGKIINTASVAGLHPAPLSPVYSGTKHGVVGLTKSYGQPFYYDKTGVTVCVVCPGSIDTNLFHIFPSLVLPQEEARIFIEAEKPKAISPMEVAQAVVQLLQDGKNGAIISVDSSGASYVD